MRNTNVLTEVSPITALDSFVLFERHKKGFSYPVHIHNECELNFVKGAAGAQRIVGDNVSDIGDKDLVLITGSNLEHAWLDGLMDPTADVYEVTIQFHPDLFASGFIDKKQFFPIKRMLEYARHGIAFSRETIDRVETLIGQLAASDGFPSILLFLELLNTLATEGSYQVLSQYSQYTELETHYDSRRITRVMKYLNENYHQNITLNQISALVNMSQPSFSRFIKQRTGQSFVNVLNNIRVSMAARALIEEPTRTISEIAYKCGFNNLSNFNRIFRKKKNMTPHEYRQCYSRRQIIV